MDKSQLAALSPEQQRLLLAKLLKQQAEAAKRFPMSAGQQGLWHAFRRNPQLTAFNVFLPTRVRDRFDPLALQQAMNYIAQRHAALRTTFTDEGGSLLQVVHDRLDPEFSSSRMLGASDDAVRQRVMLETLVPFDLVQGPLMRISVYQLADDDWIILALTHHIIVDFWSLVLILSELRQAYPAFAAGQVPQLAAPIDNYRQFVQDQAQLMNGPSGAKLASFWADYLKDVPPVLELPLDKPRPPAFTHRADNCPVRLREDVSTRVTQLASTCRATPFAVMHSAMQVLLSRYSRQEEFLIGSPFAGRLHQKYEQTVGFFINMLPVKATVTSELTFAQLVQQTTMRLVDTLEHEAFPIAEITRRAGIGRDSSRSPLFQVSCTFERAQKQEELGRASFLFPDQTVVFDFGGLHQESFYIPHPTCHYDLEFVFEQSTRGIQAMLIYCRDLFSAATIARMSQNFASLINNLLDNPNVPLGELGWGADQTTAPSPTDTTQRLQAGRSIANTVHGRIVHTAEQHPGVIALHASGTSLTYAQLATLALGLSRQIPTATTEDRLIPVVCADGCSASVGMLAVQLSAAAPVPIDLNQPSIELTQLLADTATDVILTDQAERLSSLFPGIQVIDIHCAKPELPETPAKSIFPTTAADLAYMIYTSGSTGVPKGVLVEHRAICNTLDWRDRVLPLSPEDRVLMLLSHQFDAAVGICWSALCQGAGVVWPDSITKRDPAGLLELVRRERITILPAVPSLLRVLVAEPSFGDCTTLRAIWTGGEAVPTDLPELVRTRLNVQLWNLYGPTEAAVEATANDITDHQPHDLMTIGRPIDNVEIMAVDARGRPLPPTVPGELAIGGAGLARGYHRDAALSRSRFVTHPESGRRLYLTGDIGRVLTDGRVEFMGRVDHQVKLRGYRIELGEIESILQAHPAVDRAAVVVDQPGTPAAQLIAYVAPVPANHIDVEEIRTYLAQRLPQFKQPAALVVLDTMPLTSSGKVDRRRLPAQVPEQSWLDNIVAARNALEQYLVAAWCAELKLPNTGIHQNFFEVGGSSLQAAMLTTKLSEQLQVNVPTALLFDLADIAQLAERLAMLHPAVLAARFGSETIQFYEGVQSSGDGSPHPLLAPLKTSGDQAPIFMVHPPGGIVVCYRELARYMAAAQPLWAIRSRGLHGDEPLPQSMEQMAADYLQAVRTVQPQGPYTLGGWSLGGLIAYEMAKQLLVAGESIQRLIFLDTTIPEGAADCVPASEQVNVGLEYGIELTLDQLGDLSPEEQLPLLHDHADKLGILDTQSAPEVVERVLADLQGLFHHHVSLSRQYRLTPINARLLLLRPQEVPFDLHVSEDRGWRHLLPNVNVRFVPGHHHSMVQTPNVRRVADVIAQVFPS